MKITKQEWSEFWAAVDPWDRMCVEYMKDCVLPNDPPTTVYTIEEETEVQSVRDLKDVSPIPGLLSRKDLDNIHCGKPVYLSTLVRRWRRQRGTLTLSVTLPKEHEEEFRAWCTEHEFQVSK